MGRHVEKLKASFAKDLAEAESQDRIETAIEGLGLPMPQKVLTTSQYGSVGYASWRFSARQETSPVETALLIASTLPGVPLSKVRDGCLAFRPTQTINGDELSERTEVTPISPVTVTVDPVCGVEVTAEWYTEVESLGLLRIVLAWDALPYSLIFKAKSTRCFERGRIFKPQDCSLMVRLGAINIVDSTGRPVAESTGSPIRWASGGDEKYPPRFTVIWTDIDEPGATVADILRHVFT